MPFEIMPIRGVSNHYGPRPVGGVEGGFGSSDDGKRTFAFDGTAPNLPTDTINVAPGTYVFEAEYGDASTTLTLAGVALAAGATVVVTETSAGFVFAGTGKTMIDAKQLMA